MRKKLTREHSKQFELLALFGAFSLFLSTIEFIIPKPLPFVRLGLANLPILISLEVFEPRLTLLLVLVKVIGQGLINGTMFSYTFLFSAAGSFAAGITMIGLKKIGKQHISLVGISIAGAFSSNAVQLFIAGALIIGQGALLIAPPFLAVGLISSIALGVFANRFRGQSEWLAALKQDTGQPP
jgi:uncharacterized membrane protein